MQSIHLQGIGKVKAKPAIEFNIGEKFCWNYGYKSEIIGIIKETPAFITYKTQTDTGKTWSRRIKKTRLVAIG